MVECCSFDKAIKDSKLVDVIMREIDTLQEKYIWELVNLSSHKKKY